MEDLKQVGSNYKEYQEKLKTYKGQIRIFKKSKQSNDINNIKNQIKNLKITQKKYYSTLTKRERKVYHEWQWIYFDIMKKDLLRRFDKIEGKIFRKVNPAYIYMLPAAFGALFFTLLPFLFMIVGSFFKVDLVSINNSVYRGTWNYKMIFTRDTEFRQAIGNTVLFAFITIIALMVITLLMAAWLSKNTRIHNATQTMIFTPHIASMVAVSILWILMLDPQGIINQILKLLNIKGPNWLMDTRTSLISVAIVTVWKSIGYYVLIIIAGLQAIPVYVYEAAKLDKASKFTIFRKITVPLLSPTLMFVFITKFINSFKAFAAIDLMTSGGPRGSSMVLGYWIYTAGRVKFNYGFSMAGAVVLTLMISVVTLIAYKFFNKKVVYN